MAISGDEYRQLIEFLGQRFEAIDQRFEAIDQRFDRMERTSDERFREILGHFDAVYQRLDRLEQEYHMIVQGLRRIEVRLADHETRRELLERGVEQLKRDLIALQARIENLERHLPG